MYMYIVVYSILDSSLVVVRWIVRTTILPQDLLMSFAHRKRTLSTLTQLTKPRSFVEWSSIGSVGLAVH